MITDSTNLFCSTWKVNRTETVIFSCKCLLSALVKCEGLPVHHFTCYKVESSNFWSFRGQNRTILKLVIVTYKQIIDLEITHWFNYTRCFMFSTPHRIWVALFLTMSLVTHDFVSWTRNSTYRYIKMHVVARFNMAKECFSMPLSRHKYTLPYTYGISASLMYSNHRILVVWISVHVCRS